MNTNEYLDYYLGDYMNADVLYALPGPTRQWDSHTPYSEYIIRRDCMLEDMLFAKNPDDYEWRKAVIMSQINRMPWEREEYRQPGVVFYAPDIDYWIEHKYNMFYEYICGNPELELQYWWNLLWTIISLEGYDANSGNLFLGNCMPELIDKLTELEMHVYPATYEPEWAIRDYLSEMPPREEWSDERWKMFDRFKELLGLTLLV